MRSNVRKIVMLMSLVFCMSISMFAIKANAADVDTTTPIDNCEKEIREYTAEEASEYISGNNKYPELKNYLFAGWYTTDKIPEDKSKALEYVIFDSIPDDTAKVYALFVPEHVLSVKAQVVSHMMNDNVTDDSSASIRFVTSVDSLLYQRVGFEVSYIGSDGKLQEVLSESKTVYKRLYVAGSEEDVWEVTPEGLFCGVSRYFKASTVTDVPANYYKTEFIVKPYWITLSGDKVYGVEVTKNIEEGCLRDDVYLAPDGQNIPYHGSYNHPYATLDYALAHVNDGQTIHVKEDFAFATSDEWTAHGKKATITGDVKDNAVEKLDFSALAELHIKDAVTFKGIALQTPAEVYAEGNAVTIAKDVTLLSTPTIYGGSNAQTVANTELNLYTGTYAAIYGGGNGQKVNGKAKVTVNGDINNSITHTNHDGTNNLYGGGNKGTVGNVEIHVKDAKFHYVYGGGNGAAVTGKTSVEFAGYAMSIYGGGYNGAVAGTKVVMTDGFAEQIFGGCRNKSMTGNTDVQILGGQVKRRIYGGCYNDYKNYGSTLSPKYEWVAIHDGKDPYQVNGHTNVTIGPDANITFNYYDTLVKVDNSLYAISRYSAPLPNEWGTFILNENSTYLNKLGYQDTIYKDAFSKNTHHYLVTTNGNTAGIGEEELYGTVASEGAYIRVKPKSGNAATVYKVADNGTKTELHYTESESVCALPTLTNATDSCKIYVSFGTRSTASEDYKAKVGEGYYYSLEGAVNAANLLSTTAKTSEEATQVVTLLKNVEVESTMSISASANVTIQNESGKSLTINRGPGLSTSSMFNVGSEATLTIEGIGETGLTVDGRMQEEVAANKVLKDVAGSTGSLITSAGHVKLTNITVQYAKKSDGTGGVIYSTGGSITVIGSGFLYNTATRGGAIHTNGVNVKIKNTVFSNNVVTGDGYGGAIYSQKGSLTLENSEFIGNSGIYGGAIRTNSQVAITDCLFERNTANTQGGAIYNQSTSMTVTDTQFLDNVAARGGAVYSNGETVVLTVKNSKFAGNAAISETTGAGGAIYNSSSATLTLTAQNDEGDSGLAIFESNESKQTTNNLGGGAICAGSGTVMITGYKFSGNHAVNSGGAIYLADDASGAVISNVTYTDNAVTGEGAKGPDIYIEGQDDGTMKPGDGLTDTNIGSGTGDKETIPF